MGYEFTTGAPITEEEALAHLHWRIGANLVRAGESDRGHFDRAGELAPHDFTVRRSALPLVGKNPFGDDFFEMFEEFKDAGRPIHGLRPTRRRCHQPAAREFGGARGAGARRQRD